jgi:hypothetical protein
MNRKNELTEDEQFIVKKVEIDVLKNYNKYRLSFMLVSLGICVSAAASTKRSI